MGLAAAAGIGAVGSIAAGAINSSAASSASAQQAQSANNALAQQKAMFGTAQTALNPFITAGQGATGQLTALTTPGSTQTNAIAQNPGLKFQTQYGDLATQNALTAQGLGGSGGPLGMALSNYNQGLASTYYGNAVNQLQAYVNSGVNAGGALAGDAINSGNAMANTTQNIGNAQAAGTLGSANAIAGGLTGAGSSAGNALLISQLLGNGGSGGSTSIYGSGAAATNTPYWQNAFAGS